MEIVRTAPTSPPRIVIYGIDGVGKSTFASQCPEPVFITTERGADLLNVDAIKPAPKTWNDLLLSLDYLTTQEHGHKTLVLDTLDWAQKLLWAKIAEEANVASIADIPFGRGYAKADMLWLDFLSLLDTLNEENKMLIVCLAHCKLERIEPPDSEPWTSYTLDLHGGTASQKGTARITAEWCDILGFASFATNVKTREGSFGKKTARVSQGDRILSLEKRPAFHAKNRYGLPEELPLDWGSLATALKGRNKQQKES